MAVVLVVVAAGVYWFGIRGDEDNPKAKSTSNPTSTPLAAQKFQMSGVPFTFEYPGTFAKGKAATGFIWIAGISPVDIIDIRRVADREYSASGLDTAMGETLRRQKGVTITGRGTDTLDGVKVVTYSVVSGTTTPLSSKLIFLSREGSTWQIECQSQATNKAVIESACAQVQATFKVA
jgi:hypothetical protein